MSYELLNKDGKPFRPYQYIMRDHMIRVKKSAIWSFMGSGKTAATLTALDTIQLAEDSRPALVVAPLRVAREVWTNEVREWPHLKHLRVVPVLGSAYERRTALTTPADLYTINYENIEWLVTHLNGAWPFGTLVLDESTKIKSLRASIRKNADGTEWVQGQGGKRAKALLKACYKYSIPRIIELTGTPSPNGLVDLWGQIFFLDYGKRLGRVFDAFKNRWFQVSFDGWGMEPQPHAAEQIHAALRDVCMSLKAEDWFDVSAPIIRRINVTLPPDSMKKYKEMERTLFAEIQGHAIEAFNAGARTQKCLQFASGAAYIGSPLDHDRKWVEVHDAKLDALEEIAEEAAGMPLLVAYHFKADLVRLKKRFPKGRELDHQSKTIADWNAGRIPMLFSHPASAGHGLSLQKGSNILVDFTCSWNAEEHQQILERIGPVRQQQSGLNRPVYRYHIVAKNTLDEDVLDALENKKTVQEALIDAMRKRG